MGVAAALFFPFFAGIELLLRSLEQLEHGCLKEKEDDLSFLRGMLKTTEFKSLLEVK